MVSIDYSNIVGAIIKLGLYAYLASNPSGLINILPGIAGDIISSFDPTKKPNVTKSFERLIQKSLDVTFKPYFNKQQINKIKETIFSVDKMQEYLMGNAYDLLSKSFLDALNQLEPTKNQDWTLLNTDEILKKLLLTINTGIQKDPNLLILDTNVNTHLIVEIIGNLPGGNSAPVNYPKYLTPIELFTPESILHREREINELVERLLNSQRIVMISGSAGLGKTKLARAVCNDLEDQLDHIAWLTYDGSLENQLLTLRILEQNLDRQNRLFQIKEFLNTTEKNVLIVLDKVNDIPSHADLQTIASFSPTVKVLITSRLPEIRGVEVYPLYALPLESCMDIFYMHYKLDPNKEQKKAAQNIVNSVGLNTFIVELLARSAQAEGEKLEVVWEKMQKRGFAFSEARLATERLTNPQTLQEYVKTLYEMAGLDEAKQRILRVFSVLPHSTPIPVQIKNWMPCDINDLNWLVERSWLQQNELGYTMHQLLQESIRLQTQATLEDCQGLIESFSQEEFISGELPYTEKMKRIIYADSMLEFFQPIPENLDFSLLLQNNAHYHQSYLGDYPQALSYYQKVMAINEKVLGLEHPDTASSYNNIGILYHNQGDYDQALSYYQKALAIHENVLGSEHPDTASSYCNIGILYHDQGDYERALIYYQKALAIHEKVLGLEHPDTASSYNNIGILYHDQGDYPKALNYYQKALAIREKVLGLEHPDTASSYNNVGLLYYNQRDYEQALIYYQKASGIYEKVLGLEHPDTARSYNNIGILYHTQGDYPQALSYYQKALAIREKVLGLEHPDTASSYNNIGLLYHNQGDYEQALKYYQKALAIREKVLGLEHPDIATSYNNFGALYKVQGNYAQALSYYQKALAIREKVLGLEHPDTASSYGNIGILYSDQGDYAQALSYYQKALAIREKVLGLEHPDTASSYNNIGSLYADQGDYPQALSYYQKALAIREKVLGLEHPDTASSYNNIGILYSDQGDYELALSYCQKALAIRKKVLGSEHPDTASSYNNIGILYRVQGDYEQAFDYFFKAYRVLKLKLNPNHPKLQTVYKNLKLTYEKTPVFTEPFEDWLEKALKSKNVNFPHLSN